MQGFFYEGEAPADLTRDVLKRFNYDVARAAAILREQGWGRDDDGKLRNHSDGRQYKIELRATLGYERVVAVTADYWRQLGIEVEELIVPGPRVRDLEYRALYPSWETTAPGIVPTFLTGPTAGPQTRWLGNRSGFEDPRAASLALTYQTALSSRDREQAARGISEYLVTELPHLPLYWLVDYLGVRKGVRALGDTDGGKSGLVGFGGYLRNAHLWEAGD
jgi:ABC-type transport system substrate-binding protein